METEPTIVRWPGGDPDPDPWDDGCWPSLDEEGRFDAVWEAWDAWRRGRGTLEGFEAAATTAGLTRPVLDDRNTPEWGLPVPSLEVLARIALDHWPGAGGDAPDLVLGPESLFASRELRLAAVAGCAFARTEDLPHNAFHIWCRSKPIPSAALRASIRAVELAPWALWRVAGRQGERVVLADATGLGERYLPEGPVRVVGDLPVEGALAARVLRGEDGWVAHTVVPLTALPPRAEVEEWIRHETWLARTLQPGITRESLLRKRPILVRRAIEHVVYGQSPPAAVRPAP